MNERWFPSRMGGSDEYENSNKYGIVISKRGCRTGIYLITRPSGAFSSLMADFMAGWIY
jgi:hypothetical protein